jgi:hypothetical protein
VALERAHEDETQCGNLAYDGPDGQLPLLEQTGLIEAQVLQSKLVRRFGKVAGELFERAQILSGCRIRVVAALEFFKHDPA